jgi:predicted PurR-regulated permease PerM
MNNNNYKPWSYTTRMLVAIVGAIGLVWLIVVAAPLIESLLIAALLGYLLDPVVEALARWLRLSRRAAARMVYVLFLLILLSIPAALSTVALSQFDQIQADLLAAIEQSRRWLAQPLEFLGFELVLTQLLDNLSQTANSAVALLPGGALNVLASVTTNLLWALTVVVSLYYFLIDGPRIKPWLVSLLPPDYQEETRRLLDEIDYAWRLFLRAQILIFVILAVLFALSTFLIVFLFRSGLLPLSPVGLAVLLVIVYALVQQVDNIWLRPYLFGERLKLHPGLVFVGLIGGLALSGVLGVIVVVPAIATVKIVAGYAHRRLLGQPPWPDAPPEGQRQENGEPEAEPAESGSASEQKPA